MHRSNSLNKITESTFIKKHSTLRALVSKTCLGISLNLSASALVYSAEIEEILITEQLREGYKIDQSSLSKFTESLLDTPQTITAISAQLMEDRAVMSLDDVLRNVPGITLGAGEFSWQGNNPSIRGFSSRNDIFLDGMRDFGSYSRDPFNLESVEVLQGPSSMIFGRGSTGGIINQASKTPQLDPIRKLHANVGNADTRRLTADLNEPLSNMGQGSAVRLNLMTHQSEVAGRDSGESERYGIAPSLTIGMNSATQLTLSYLKLNAESSPDYGLPWIDGRPADVERETFYGFNSDFVNTDAEITTLQLNHDINANLSANAQLRYADYYRESRITEPQVDSSTPSGTPLDSVLINRNIFRGESNERMFQSQFNLLGNYLIGNIEHAIVAGVEFSHETSTPSFGFGVGVPGTTLVNPVAGAFSATSTAPRLIADTNGDSKAAFVIDTIKFNEQWQLILGWRWDKFDTNYIAERFDVNGTSTGTEQFISTDIESSYRTALVYKPVDEGTVYLGWGTSFNPSSEGLSQISSGRGLTISNAYLDPETNESIELGIKWELLHQNVFLETSVFHITKSNARVPDPNNAGFNILAGEQVVDGFSINLSGNLTEQIQLSGGYTYLDSKQKETTSLTVPQDSPLQNVAENTFSLWMNYTFSDRFQFGAGTRFVDERLATISLPTKSVPDYWAFDAMSKYQVSDNLTLKLNITNFTDEYYFDQLHPWHVIPGPGLTSVFAINLDY